MILEVFHLGVMATGESWRQGCRVAGKTGIPAVEVLKCPAADGATGEDDVWGLEVFHDRILMVAMIWSANGPST